MPDALLLFDIDVQVAHHNQAALGANILLAPTELAGGHVPLHDVDAVLLVEGDAGHFVEADNVVLTHQAPLAIRIVDEHFGHGRLAAGDEMGIG